MPGNVASASPTEVMPAFLCRAFERSQQWRHMANQYANGEHEAATELTNSRKRWALSPIATAAQIAALRNFFEDRRGGTEEFYFYDPFEADFVHDPTGTETDGRYAVRFDGNWQHSTNFGRISADFALIEIL